MLADWRNEHGLSQSRLAEWLGCKTATIAAYENGRRKAGLRVALALESLSGGRVPAACWTVPENGAG